MQLSRVYVSLLLGLCTVLAQWPEERLVPSTLQPLDFAPQQRIVGGARASAGQFRHQVSLRQNGEHICGGSIISGNYVLTAAHCVKFGQRVTPAGELSVRAGSLQRNSGGIVVPVAEVRVHPGYDASRNLNNDVALLRLRSSLPSNQQIGAVRLRASDAPENAEVLASGWGRIHQGGPLSNELLYVKLRTISRQSCSRYLYRLPDTIVCLLHGQNIGACQGDSGGPAVYNGELIGVASFVLGSCGRSAPDGYTRVAGVRSWIARNSGV